MHLLRGSEDLRSIRAKWSKSNQSISLVPTMGALHAGHQELIKRARENSDRVVVSIFVNPLQFGSDTDFGEYPRNFDLDQDLLESMEVDAIYSPSVEEIYPEGLDRVRTIPAGELGEILEGRSRPGHFSGMLTVVKRLFEQVSPRIAVFGEKDAQQYFLIGRMVADYKMPIQLLEVPTVRDKNGLALSSRNTFLSSNGRKIAQTITLARESARQATNPVAARIGARHVLDGDKGVTVDYVEIVDADSFVPIENDDFTGFGRLVVAVVIDGVRLLDTELFEFDR